MGAVLHFVAMADFPNRLYELRRARGLSQQKLADLAGCSKMHVSGVERGTREFSLSLMRRIAEVFGVAPGDLLSEADNPHRLADPDEIQLIETYRHAQADDKPKILRVAETIAPYEAERAIERTAA